MKVFDIQLLKRIITYSKPYKKTFRNIIAWSIILSVFAALRPYLLKETVDNYITTFDQEGLIFSIGLMAIALFIEVVAQFFFVYDSNWLGQHIVKDIRMKLFAQMLKFRINYFDNSPVGQLVTRTVSDMEAISRIFSQGLFMIISDLLKMIVVLIFMFYMNWKLTCIVILAMPLLLYATRLFQIKMKSAFEEVRTQISSLNTFIQERVSGMKIVQLFNREKVEYEKFRQINDKHRVAWNKTVWYNSIFFPIADIISTLTLGVIVWYAGVQIIDGDSSTSLGDISAYTMYITILFNPLRQIADKFNEMQMGMVAANRVFGILDQQDKIQQEGSEIAPIFKGDIEFKNVSFGYLPEQKVIQNLNFKVAKGQTVAIVGATGAGKSTIINLINRFYEINEGEILIDGKNINAFELQSLRNQIAVVLQDVFLFADSIYENITLGNTRITEEDVIEAAKKIGVHTFISQLPNGYHYNVKERGTMLSAGQRQSISFLRAYVSNPSILVLDEATSSIDSNSEELIQNATAQITADRTSIIIAHRLATIKNADVIMVMDKGQLVEKGTHEELLKIDNGYYKNLYLSQFSEEV